MVGFPFLREAFLFGIVLYIWGMGKGKELRKVSVLIALLYYSVVMATVWGCHHFDPYDGSYQYAMDKTYVYSIATVALIVISWVASLFITDQTPPTAWWDGVHEMD